MRIALYIIWPLCAIGALLVPAFIYKPKTSQYIMWALSAIGALLLSVFTYKPKTNPYMFFVFFAAVPLVIALVANRKQLKVAVLVSGVALSVIYASYWLNLHRYEAFTKTYLSMDTPFNSAAQKILPDLSEFDASVELEHYHGLAWDEEWVVLKVKLAPDDFYRNVSEMKEEHIFYDTDFITDGLLSGSPTSFQVDNYQFEILDLTRYPGKPGSDLVYCGATIGVNESANCIMYIFIDSGLLSFMQFDSIVEGIWPDIGVQTQS